MNQKIERDLLKIVANNYRVAAEDFNITRRKALWPAITTITTPVKDGESVLDVGCGNGRLLEAFKDREIKYLGLDQSEALVKLAQNNYPGHHFRKGDILDLGNIKEHNFDYVFCLAVLHHLPSNRLRLQAMKQLKNKVKSGGKIIISVWNLWGHKKYRRLIWRFWFLKIFRKNKMGFGDILFDWKDSSSRTLSQRYYHAFNNRELKRLAGAAGLKIDALERDSHNYWLLVSKK